MTDSAALARRLAELDKVAIPLPHRLERYEHGGGRQWKNDPDNRRELVADTFHEAERELFWLLRNNLPAILRALCVQAAAEEIKYGPGYDWLNKRADELLAELGVAK